MLVLSLAVDEVLGQYGSEVWPVLYVEKSNILTVFHIQICQIIYHWKNSTGSLQ